MGVSLAVAGRIVEASAAIEAAVALGKRLGHPHSLGHAYWEAALVSQIAGDRAAVDRASRRLIEIASKYGFPPHHAMGLFFSGWSRAEGPELPAGLDQMEAAFEGASTLGPMPNYFATLLAETRLRSGRVAEAYRLIEETLAAVSGRDVGFYLPQLLRLREECLAQLPPETPIDPSGPLATVVQLAEIHRQRLSALDAVIASSPDPRSTEHEVS